MTGAPSAAGAIRASRSSDSPLRTSFPTAEDPGPELVADLHAFLDEGRPPAERRAPRRSRELAAQLFERLLPLPGRSERLTATLAQRIVTDDVLRAEADRDQNVYLGSLFTRVLSTAVPDVILLPATAGEVEEAMRWARDAAVPVTVRGAASTAMGGAVPCAGGLTLDLSRLEHIDIDADADVCVVGAGARLRDIHARLAAAGLALPVYPSNLGATYAGWFVTGGLGLNAFSGRSASGIVRAADVVLPTGELVRFHADGRLDVPGDGRQSHREVPPDKAEAWFRRHDLEPFGLADLAGSEGLLGVVVQLALRVGRRPKIGAFLLAFESAPEAVAAAAAIERAAGRTLPQPANLRLVLASHLRHLRAIWAEEDARAWRRLPSVLSAGEGMPWERIAGPDELGVAIAAAGSGPAAGGPEEAAAYLYVDFLTLSAARAFGASIAALPGRPRVLGAESVRFCAERFRPQQSKRFGPGLLAAELTLPADQLGGYLRAAWRLARRAGVELDPEVYYLGGGQALLIAGYLTDHRIASFYADLALAPVLLDLAVRAYGGRPYVLGRWQAPFAAARFGEAGLARLRAVKVGLDPDDLLSRGVVLGMGLRSPVDRIAEKVYRPGVALLRGIWATPGLAAVGRAVRTAIGKVAGPAKGHGEAAGKAGAVPSSRAIHCVNCGECNSVCPVCDAAGILLPQTLTHHAELFHAGRTPRGGVRTLLDLCMRCGNCQEVCQAGIEHLVVYEAMDDACVGEPAGEAGVTDVTAAARGRRLALASIRALARYRESFLAVRPGTYLRRAPAALPGGVRFRVIRAESGDGPAATCIHCAACVPACPTGANREYAAVDVRLVTTDEASCIGCGSCVEVCPANKRNGGQTLRVVEAPTAATLAVIDEWLATT